MQSGRSLRRKKTNLAPALANSQTLYAPGAHPVPYGANGVMVGGRGTPGNSPEPGTYKSGGNRNAVYRWGYSYTQYYDTTNMKMWDSVGDDPWGPTTGPKPPTYTYWANATPNGNYPGPSLVNYTVSGTGGGNYNPTYYNPDVPGNRGADVNIGGVTFPGGAVDSTAPLVPPTMSSFKYKASGISITVPSGGTVTLTPIGK